MHRKLLLEHITIKDWVVLAVANIGAVLFFFLLYRVFPYKPYSNMLYFLLLAIVGVFYARKYSLYKADFGFRKTFTWSIIGSAIMLVGYGILVASYTFFLKHPELSKMADTQQWPRFVAPWIRINRVVSVAGIVLVVIATEYFYRAYVQALLAKALKNPWYALLATAVLSGLRGISGGRLAGPFDFILSMFWGWIYIEGGLTAALISHMVWDIFFVYFVP